MKIEILNQDPSGARGNQISCNGKILQNANGAMFPRDFSEDEIYHILGEKAAQRYEKGEYSFEVPAWKLKIASGEGLSNATPQQNIWSHEYSKL